MDINHQSAEQMTIGVVIPTLGNSTHLAKTLISVSTSINYAKKHLRLKTVIVVDNNKNFVVNGSSCVKDMGFDLLIIRDGKKSKGKAINAGADFLGCCNYITIIDDDVIVEKECILRLVARLKETTRKVVCARWIPIINSNNGVYRRFLQDLFSLRFNHGILLESRQYLRGGCVLMKRESLPRFPEEEIINDDQFLQIQCDNNYEEVNNSVIIVDCGNSIRGYYRRFRRIYFGAERIQQLYPRHSSKVARSHRTNFYVIGKECGISVAFKHFIYCILRSICYHLCIIDKSKKIKWR